MTIKFSVLRASLVLKAVLYAVLAASQPPEEYPVIGQPIPDFRLTDVHYYDKKTFDANEGNEKWIIMDFWETGCVSCVQSFPKVDQLQREFKDHILFMLVGKNDQKYNKNIKNIFDRYRMKLGLNLPVAYDTAIFKQFRVRGVPHIVVIDPEKNVYAVTDGYFLNRESLSALIANKKPAFNSIMFSASETNFTAEWKYLLKEREMDGRDFLFRSILCKNKGEPVQGSWDINEFASQGIYQVIGVSLSELYEVAYFSAIHWTRGQPSLYNHCWRYPILEIRDSSLFQVNNIDKSGLYNYSVTVPKAKASREYLMEAMRNDLKRYFGYEVAIETRMMPYWKLTATSQARKKLRTKSERAYHRFEPLDVDVKNIPMSLIIDHIQFYNLDEHCPFIDETNITENIDINFSAVMTDMNAVQKALQNNGLMLEKTKKEFKVLVLRDPKQMDQ